MSYCSLRLIIHLYTVLNSLLASLNVRIQSLTPHVESRVLKLHYSGFEPIQQTQYVQYITLHNNMLV